MATEFSLATFVGIDIAPMFPTKTPSNVAFLKCNVLDGLPFPDNTFDFVREELVVICIDWEQWKDKVVNELIRVTKPGGYIEIMDCDGLIIDAGKISSMFNHCCKYSRMLGMIVVTLLFTDLHSSTFVYS
jgi:ubiquinone/menaquinone biosynthesis C-methylase UbiE